MIEVNPHCSARVIHVGADSEPVLIVDDLVLDPEALVAYADTGAAFRKEEKDFYPGIRKPIDTAYAEAVFRHLHALFVDTFGAGARGMINPLSSVFSLATTKPEQLRPIQSVPHFDSYDATCIAGVHYLCTEQWGGTSFYRHRSTGYEAMTAQRLERYAPRLKAEVMGMNMRQFAYIRGDTALFERTGGVAAKFNRAIYYRSNILHAGDISDTIGMPATPREGRLTVNTLAEIRLPA